MIDNKRILISTLASSDWGAFFDVSIPDSIERGRLNQTPLKRIVQILKAKKTDLTEFCPVKYDIIKTVSNMLANYTIGDGLNYNVSNSQFDDFWVYDDMIRKAVVDMLVYGYAFIRTTNPDGKLELVDWSNVRLIDGIYQIWSPIEHEGSNYILVSEFIDGLVYNRIYTANGTKLGTEVPNMLEVLYPNATAVEEGTYYIMQSDEISEVDGLGVSYFERVIDKIQLITLYDIMISLENQEHFLSKMEVSKALLDNLVASGVNIKDMSYIPRISDPRDGETAGARYVSKDISSYDAIDRHRTSMINDIAFTLQIPRQVLTTEDASAVRVEAIKQSQQPLARLVKSLQSKVYELFRSILFDKFGDVEFSIAFDSIYDVDIDERRFILELYSNNIIGRKEALKHIFSDYTNDKIDELLQDNTLRLSGGATVDDIINQL